MVILACLKLGGQDVHESPTGASRPLLYLGIVGNLVLLVYVVVDDPSRCCGAPGCSPSAGCSTLLEYFFGARADRRRGTADPTERV